jgi:hypothetical protein
VRALPVALVALSVLLVSGCGREREPPRLLVGAVDDAARFGHAEQAMPRAWNAGLRAVVLSTVWKPPLDSLPSRDLAGLQEAVAAAAATGVRPMVAVYQFSGATPLTARGREQFARYAASIPRLLPEVRDLFVGNEPNLNLFWLPQFARNGSDAAAPAYLQLLAETYDAIKAVNPQVNVIGGNLAPRGGDDPDAPRQTHSPTRFIEDLGAAYRASGRSRPVMDMFSIHPYPESPRIPPTFAHPRTTSIGIADYRKLVRLLDRAFGGTLPIVYGEYGVETATPRPARSLSQSAESSRSISAAAQARTYAQAIRLAACQPRVRMLLFFHVADEPELSGLQTGVYYADGTPKESRSVVAAAADSAASGEISCPGSAP